MAILLWDNSNLNRLISSGINSNCRLNFNYFRHVLSLFEVDFPHFDFAEDLIDEFLVMCLVLLVVAKRLRQFLHLDPLV